jgi:hypothetical protein
MKPIVVLDSNSLHGRKPLRSANSRLIQALSKSGQIRLVLPDVVLHELARQWAEEADDHASKLRAARKALNETLDELDEQNIDVPLPSLDRARFYEHAKRRLSGKCVDIPAAPNVAVEKLLDKDLGVKKPFNREGKGFRDALIWETIRALCDDLEESAGPVIFVTNNHADFCEKKGGRLHPDLREDLAADREIEVVPSIYDLLKHEAIQALADSHSEIENQLGQDRLEVLIDRTVAELYGRDVEDAVGVYIGSGMYDLPVSTGLQASTFDEIMPDFATLDYDIFRDGHESTIRVTFEADCSFDGLIDKSEYLTDEGDDYALLEDWNDHMFRVATSGRVRFVLSGTISGTDLDGLILTLDEAETVSE